MRSRAGAILGLMAAATMGQAQPVRAAPGLRVQLCGGGTVELPIPGHRRDRDQHQSACHALCEHRRSQKKGQGNGAGC
jgi:hypothetical protein